MKNCNGLLTIALILFLPVSLSAAARLEYRIARWQGFSKAAVTITFDDNCRFQVVYATPLLDAHNYKATYFIVTNRVGKGRAPGWDTIAMLASRGHEIASHSKNHPDFVSLAENPRWADSMIHEFRDSRDTINARVPSQRCETFAWPNGEVDVAALDVSKNYYMACRGSENYFNDSIVVYHNISSQHIYHDTPLETVNGYIDSIMVKRGWLVERYHGFQVNDDTNGYEPVPIKEFADHIEYIAGNEQDLWITTLDSVVKYIQERQSSVLALVDSSGDEVQFSLTNNLPDTLFHFNIPLTLRVRQYGKMSGVYRITQGSAVLPYKTVTEDGSTYIFFDAIPNNGLIEMHVMDAGTHDPIALKEGALNYPNPFTTSTTILFSLPEAEQADILVYDPFGRQLRDYSNFYPPGRNSIQFDGEDLAPGIYQCIIRTREKEMNIRMIVVH